ncbi:hypothetical protein SODALDRAFT_354479 [Sodiomyces alkalinus F11]|uniref:Uncharacterized protein n=1 Tax=Sodiomyces alkalinus (strain CBS 110278 / VKM F-3762 / F11) TaxID=1314773 RepID=A0A3N2Q6V3_SODAK|nr:hypothetical protein SODALDRAFT_354479 [Sodiomyces alkalinus F11]ROT42345.1 hypothetical protein SODALDRAFT_354479 [Sodiomyces alkalinus F11]
MGHTDPTLPFTLTSRSSHHRQPSAVQRLNMVANRLHSPTIPLLTFVVDRQGGKMNPTLAYRSSGNRGPIAQSFKNMHPRNTCHPSTPYIDPKVSIKGEPFNSYSDGLIMLHEMQDLSSTMGAFQAAVPAHAESSGLAASQIIAGVCSMVSAVYTRVSVTVLQVVESWFGFWAEHLLMPPIKHLPSRGLGIRMSNNLCATTTEIAVHCLRTPT